MVCDQRCDLNGDGVVDNLDEAIFQAAYESKSGDSNWNPACDFNGDGEVGFDDFMYFADNVGCTFDVAEVTLEWVRDNYDANKNRYIDDAEIPLAEDHWNDGIITDEQYDAVASAWSAHILLPDYEAPSSAKGKIIYPNYPTTVMVGASITVECRVKNTGEASGTFKLALYKGATRVVQTSTWNQGAGTTTGIKRLNTTVPSTGTNVSYVLKCIRVT